MNSAPDSKAPDPNVPDPGSAAPIAAVPAPAVHPPLWAPLASGAFRTLYGALFITNICSWMNSVGSAWLMTLLDQSAIMLGLVQASFTLPGMIFSLPAGVLADKVDRRLFVVATSAVLIVTSLDVALLVALHVMTPTLLLLHTFILGTAFSLQGPAMQAVVQDMVKREHLIQALTLTAIAFNLGRSVGPAIAGSLIAAVGVAWVFAINTTGYGFLAVTVFRSAPTVSRHTARESFSQAFLSGLRFVRNDARSRTMLTRLGIFFFFASMVMALMPLVAKARLGGGPQAFGVLITWVGIGAVTSATLRGRTINRLPSEGQALVSAMLTGIGTLALAFTDTLVGASAAALVYGSGWTTGAVTYQVAAQTNVPVTMRARGVAMYLTVLYFAMVIGGLAWGKLADTFGIRIALIAAGAGGIVCDLACSRMRISGPPPSLDEATA